MPGNKEAKLEFRCGGMSMKEMAEKVGEMAKANPDREYWLDGDAQAIMSRVVA
jgi:hypothetical protein